MSEEIKKDTPVPETPPTSVTPEIVTPPGVEVKEVNIKKGIPEAAPKGPEEVNPEQKARVEMMKKIQGVSRALQQLLDQEGLTLVVEHNIKVVPKR